MSNAKTHLSKVAQNAINGERVDIASADEPIVDLVPRQKAGKRQAGGYEIVMDQFHKAGGIAALFEGDDAADSTSP